MLVLAIFFSICIAAVLFMLRFLLALDSEVRSLQTYPAARLERVSTGQAGARVRESAPAITLVHSRSRMALRPSRASRTA